MMSKILIGPSSFAESDRSPLGKLTAAGFTVIDNPYKRKITKEELCVLLKDDVVGILAGLEPLDRDVLSHSHLKCISRVGAGMTNVDIKAAKDLNIEVFNTPDGPTSAVVELTLGVLLGLLRWIPQSNQALHERRWVRKMGGQIEGKTIAIIGFGRIGRRVAELFAPFRAKLIAVDPYLTQSETFPCPLLTMEEALPKADIITIHMSGDECLFDEVTFSNMKRGVLLLNAARGNIVAEGALVKALDQGIIAGAWLDTFEKEPYAGPLCNYQNVILTPHIGSYTAECRGLMEAEAVDNLLKGLQGN
jgi:D-3-phosphoglycerate dehydrogenase / 2-oxoglutarate reductase